MKRDRTVASGSTIEGGGAMLISPSRVPKTGSGTLARSLVTYGEDEVQQWAVRPIELVPALGPETVELEVVSRKHVERERMDLPPRMTARAERVKASSAPAVQRALGHDAARRVPRA